MSRARGAGRGRGEGDEGARGFAGGDEEMDGDDNNDDGWMNG